MKYFFTATVDVFCILLVLANNTNLAVCQSSLVNEILPHEQCRSQLGNMRYQNGYFTAVRRANPRDPKGQEVVVIDKNGRCVFKSLPGQDIPDVQSFSLYDAFLGSQGLLAAVGVAVSRSGQMAYVLNSKKSVWVAIKAPTSIGKLTQLVGCDGQNVILRDRRIGKIFWIPTKS